MAATGLAAQGEIVLRAAAPRPTFAGWALSSGVMLFVLVAPVLWNGFPLIFPDTGGYLTRPLEGTLDLGRSAFYGLFLDAGIPLAFWPNVIVQAALAIWLIVLMLRAHGLGGRPWLALGIIALLSVATSLPWLTGLLLPDVWFPSAVLALYLLMFRCDVLAAWERVVLGAVIAVAIMSHMAAAGLCAGLVGAAWLSGCIARLRLLKPRLSFAASAVVVGILLCPVSNLAITGTFAFTPGGNSFLFGRLVEDGIVVRYLNDHCPDPALRLCPYKLALSEYDADDWLWNSDSPFRKLDGGHGLGAEESKIISASLVQYPGLHLAAAVNDIFNQLISFQTEVALEDNAPTINDFRNWIPHLMPRLMSARQQNGRIDVAALNFVHVPAAALAMTALVGAFIFRRRLKVKPEFAALCATVLLSLCINATICALCSHAVDRYQSRLAPLALLAAAMLTIDWWRGTHLGTTSDLS